MRPSPQDFKAIIKKDLALNGAGFFRFKGKS